MLLLQSLREVGIFDGLFGFELLRFGLCLESLVIFVHLSFIPESVANPLDLIEDMVAVVALPGIQDELLDWLTS